MTPASAKTRLYRRSTWARVSRGGILHLEADLGARARKGETIATVFDAFGKQTSRLPAKSDGIVVGHTQHPLVNQ